MRTIAALVLVLGCASAAAQDAGDALEAGDLICEIRHGYRSELLAALQPLRAPADLMLVYESLKSERPRVVSSQRPGRHAVEVRVTPLAVHLIEPVGASLRQTALIECLDSRIRNGLDVCVRFAARHAWHFDTTAYADPDAALARLPNSVSSGVCEPWTVD